MIVPLYQPFGDSTHHLAAQIGKQYDLPATHTGTLDPMAAGVIITLTGPDRFHKQEYSSWQKVYDFKILVGYSTDSHDLLGKITAHQPTKLSSTEVSTALKELSQKTTQIQPQFSSQRVAGESGFDLAKMGKNFTAKENDITITSLALLTRQQLPVEALKNKIKVMEGLNGDFRQHQIADQWKQVLENRRQPLHILSCSATVSKRTYIRAIVRDLSQKLSVPMTTWEIIRTANGPYHIADCQCLL